MNPPCDVARHAAEAEQATAQAAAAQMLASVLDCSPHAIVTLGADGRVETWNEAAALMLGWPARQAVGQDFLALIGDQTDGFLYLWERARRGLIIRQQRARFRRRGGAEFEANFSFAPLPAADGQPVRTALFLDDASEREKALEKLRRSEARHRRLLAELQDIVYERDLKGVLTSVNPAAARILGWSPDELVGKTLRELIHPEDRPIADRDLTRAHAGGDAGLPTVVRLAKKGGGWRWMEIVATQRREAGQPVGVQGIARDVTDRIEAEKELLAKTRLLEGIAAAAPVHLFVYDLDQERMTYSSAHVQRLLGWTAEEFLRQDLAALTSWVHPDDQPLLLGLQERRRCLLSDEPLHYEIRLRHKSGDWRWVRTCEVAYERDAGGRLTRTLGATVDITDEKTAQEDLAEQTRFLERMANTLPVLLHLLDLRTGHVVYLSPHLERLLGYAPEELMGRPVPELLELLHPEDREQVRAAVAAASQRSVRSPPQMQQFRARRKDGSWRWLELHDVVLSEDEAGRPTQLLGASVDITEQKLADNEVAASRKRYRELVESLDGIVWEMDLSAMCFTYVSPQAEALLGYPPAVWSEPGFLSKLLHPADRARVEQARREALGGQRDLKMEYRVVAADGRVVWLQDTSAVVSDDGRPVRQRGILVDVTARRRTEESLEETRRFLDRVTQASPLIIYVFDLETRRNIYVNRQIAAELGYSPLQIEEMGADFFSLTLHPEDLARVDELLRRWETAPDGEVVETEYRMRHADGSWRWYAARDVVFQRDAGGRARQILGAAQNITARKAAEEAYQESEARLRRLVEDADDLFILYDLEGRALYFKAPTYVRLEETEVIGKRAAEFLPAELAERVEGQNRLVLADRTARTFENEFTVGGQTLSFSDHVYPVFDRAGQLTGVGRICRNITQQKKAEEAGQELRLRLERMAQLSPCIHYVFDVQERRYLFIGRSFERILGYPVEQVMAEGERFFEKTMHPDDWAELQRLRPSWDNVPDDEVLEAELRYRHASGQYRWLRVQTLVFARTEDGRVKQRMGVAMDVTGERAAEEFRRSLEARMQQSQKLESLGILAGGIAHDFNNLLTAILGNASLVRQSMPEGAPTAELVQEIELAGRRAAELTQQMMAYAGKGRLVFQPLFLSELARETYKLLRSVLAPQATFRFDLPERLPPIEGDGTQLRQLLMNLLKNASEALESKPGEILLRTALADLTEADVAASLLPDSGRPGKHLLLEVRDTGCGMTPATLARIFDPFYTTKFTGRGLGLSAVLGIVRGHQGTLRVQTSPGEGTCFQLYFPLPRRPDSLAEGQPAEGRPPTKEPTPHNRALIVEDNASVADLTRRILQRGGYSLALAKDGEEALALFAKNPRGFDVALVDLSLPGKSGDLVCRELRTKAPALPIVVMSGYFSPSAMEALQGLANLKLLNKPFTPTQLLQTLQSFTL